MDRPRLKPGESIWADVELRDFDERIRKIWPRSTARARLNKQDGYWYIVQLRKEILDPDDPDTLLEPVMKCQQPDGQPCIPSDPHLKYLWDWCDNDRIRTKEKAALRDEFRAERDAEVERALQRENEARAKDLARPTLIALGAAPKYVQGEKLEHNSGKSED